MRHGILALLTLLLLAPAWAQSNSRAAELSSELAQVQELPTNVRLRFQVLSSEMLKLGNNFPAGDVLRFFSDTRVLFWNRPASPGTARKMQALEEQMVPLARAGGSNLVLPEVGYASPPQSNLITRERITRDSLLDSVSRTEQAATDALASRNSAELLFLRDNLARLREDLADKNVSVQTVRSVMGARARYLASTNAAAGGDQLGQSLDGLGERLRAAFPPDRMRQNPAGTITLP
ncbi:MAG: hypothetical protein WC314_13535 [Vulcanimicrobiota bacterium]